MEYFIISLAALLASGLTLFSGFGLGTLLMPVFALFFPVEVAIALTALVHFLNNIFKFSLLGRYADKSVVLKFGATAMAASFLGAQALVWLSHQQPLWSYHISTRWFHILPMNLLVAALLIFFALFEIVPRWKEFSFEKKYLPWGGVLSGFFGGLAGHQGALRSAFLLRCGLSKENYIATGIAIACLVDLSRLSVYASHFATVTWEEHGALLFIATLAAFAGAYLGNRLVKKTTLHAIQIVVTVMLLVIALALGAGFI